MCLVHKTPEVYMKSIPSLPAQESHKFISSAGTHGICPFSITSNFSDASPSQHTDVSSICRHRRCVFFRHGFQPMTAYQHKNHINSYRMQGRMAYSRFPLSLNFPMHHHPNTQAYHPSVVTGDVSFSGMGFSP